MRTIKSSYKVQPFRDINYGEYNHRTIITQYQIEPKNLSLYFYNKQFHLIGIITIK